MSENQTACAEAFSVTLKENKKNVSLAGTYRTDAARAMMREAVAFWKTIREGREAGEDPAELSETIRSYPVLGRGNTLLDTVARLELLPVRVFRKVLGFCNIDYQSFESCLRRLTSEQIVGINDTYGDLFGLSPKVPRCFTDGAYNSVRQLVPGKFVTVEELLRGEENDDLRYEARSAIDFDFFGWGMGYDKYPYGDSVKTFRIGKEEGEIYAFLHRTCRSNYLWNSGAEVKFDRNVCPEVRHTMMAWFTFLFLSPLAFMGFLGLGFPVDPWYLVALGILGIITPGILALAGVKYLFLRSVDWFMQSFPKIEIDKEYWEELGKAVLTAILILVAEAIVIGAWLTLLWFSLGNVFYATSVTVFAMIWVFHMVHYDTNWILPTNVPWVGKPVCAYIGLQAFSDYSDKVFDFVFAVFGWMSGNISTVLFWGSIALVLALWFLIERKLRAYAESEKESAFEQAEKFYTTVLYIVWFFITASFLGIIAVIVTLSSLVWTFAPVLCFVIVLQLFLVKYLTPRIVINEKKIIRAAEKPDAWRRETFYKLMVKNRWIKQLDDPLPILEKIWRFSYDFFGASRKEFCLLDKDGFAVLDEYRNYFQLHMDMDTGSYGYREDFLSFIICGTPLEEAKRIILQEIKAKAARRQKWARMTSPFQKVYGAVNMVVHSAYEYYKDRYCPFDIPPEEVK